MNRKEAEKLVRALEQFIFAKFANTTSGDIEDAVTLDECREELVQVIEVHVKSKVGER